jgi:hypothetical protein
MTTVNYPSPVLVNGYSCKNCTDVDNAKRNIDPQHPKDGPFGVNAQPKPGAVRPVDGPSDTPAVTFGGQLAQLAAADKSPTTPSATQGHKLDLSV